jgi:hypothetical protein
LFLGFKFEREITPNWFSVFEEFMIEVILLLSPLSKRISPIRTQRLSAWKKIVGHLVHPFLVCVCDAVRGEGYQGHASSARFPANSEDVLNGREAPSHLEGQETHRLTGLKAHELEGKLDLVSSSPWKEFVFWS